MVYVITKLLSKLIFSILYWPKFYGTENLPEEGSVILCANHISNLDPPLVGSFIKRPVNFMAKEEMFQTTLSNWFFRKLKSFPIKRGKVDLKGFKHAIKLLRSGEALCMFPEGTRIKDDIPTDAHNGASMLSYKTKAPIVPIGIQGPYKLFKSVKVIFGKPINISEYTDYNQSEAINKGTQDLMESINNLKMRVRNK